MASPSCDALRSSDAVPGECEVKTATAEAPSSLPSLGSRLHLAGKCKPCAFYHSRGCENGPSCIFCHECPPQEALRRKRVRRQLLRPLRTGQTGHCRQGSDASTAASSGGLVLSHSRQSSGLYSTEDGSDAGKSPVSAGPAETPSSAVGGFQASEPREASGTDSRRGLSSPSDGQPAAGVSSGRRRKVRIAPSGATTNHLGSQSCLQGAITGACGGYSPMQHGGMQGAMCSGVQYMLVPVSALPGPMQHQQYQQFQMQPQPMPLQPQLQQQANQMQPQMLSAPFPQMQQPVHQMHMPQQMPYMQQQGCGMATSFGYVSQMGPSPTFQPYVAAPTDTLPN
mmetsp:Transcript_54297/g.87712  ORF Transcript_54297/g.87712 Transcript_54297/m.87712 type:complete len:339 (-) Transcript_54297:56-1072(-)